MSKSGIYQQIFDADLTLGSGVKAVIPGEPLNPELGYVIVHESTDSNSPKELLGEFVIPPNKRKSYELAEALFDNYDLLSSVRDDITPEENAEIDDLLEYIVDREPMRIAREFIAKENGRKFTDASWYALVRESWFRRFATASSPSVSGFEHVFLGEWNASKNSVGGLHWWYFYLQKMDKIEYGGARYGNATSGLVTPEVATMTFSWDVGSRKIVKNVGGFFVGPSVEGLMAMGMVRAWAETAASNIARIEGAEIELRLFKGPDDRSIITFFPVFKRVLVGIPAIPAAPPPSSPVSDSVSNGIAQDMVEGPIRLVSAVVNPEGDDTGKEKISVMNMFSTGTVSLEGWRVVGPNNSFIEFGDVDLEAGSMQTFTLPARGSLQLSNKGGEVKVLNPDGGIVHRVRYSRSSARSQGAILYWDGRDDLIVKEANV
eukprot:GFKZ01007319.1.p1 GENE.GFKZ01007319.1~~GFKZ01007319.1.p1  ORF type:complete len:431 (+),score=62.01 GFKZ01007319.1:105-1397(+)